VLAGHKLKSLMDRRGNPYDNAKRLLSALGCRSPVNFEEEFARPTVQTDGSTPPAVPRQSQS
jgi:hypothetical protein